MQHRHTVDFLWEMGGCLRCSHKNGQTNMLPKSPQISGEGGMK